MGDRKITEATVDAIIRRHAMGPAGEFKTDSGTSAIELLVPRINKLADNLLSFESDAAAVDNDPHLSPEGKAEKRAELFQKNYEGWLQSDATDIAEVLELGEEEKARLRDVAAPPPADDPHALQLASDIRNHVREMDRDGRRKFLLDQAGDAQVISAILNAPAYLSGMSQIEHEHFRRRAMETLHPERVQRLDVLETTMAAALQARSAAERMLIARAGVRFNRREAKWEPEPTRAQAVPRGTGRPAGRKHTLTGR